MNDSEWILDLSKRYPKILPPNKTGRVSIGKGWRPIIEALFSAFTAKERSLGFTIERIEKGWDQKLVPELPKFKDELAHMKFPEIDQIKEKFGYLRIYAHNLSNEDRIFIQFAETISGKMCYECGSGDRVTTMCSKGRGWIKTLCHTHREEDGGLPTPDEDEDDEEPTIGIIIP